MFHSTKRAITSTDGEGRSSPVTLCSMESSAKLPSPQTAPSLPRQQQGLQGVDKTPQTQQVRVKEMPARCARVPGITPLGTFLQVAALGASSVPPRAGNSACHPLLTDRQTPYRQQTVVCLQGQAILRTMVGTTLQRSPHALQGQIQTEVLFPSPRTTNLNTVGEP